MAKFVQIMNDYVNVDHVAVAYIFSASPTENTLYLSGPNINNSYTFETLVGAQQALNTVT